MLPMPCLLSSVAMVTLKGFFWLGLVWFFLIGWLVGWLVLVLLFGWLIVFLCLLVCCFLICFVLF